MEYSSVDSLDLETVGPEETSERHTTAQCHQGTLSVLYRRGKEKL